LNAVDGSGHAVSVEGNADHRPVTKLFARASKFVTGETCYFPPCAQQTPEALASYHKAKIKKWWPILKAANVQDE